MGLTNLPVPSLFGGVSQQAPQLRQAGQCELSENFYPTVALGNLKRPPTEHLAHLTGSTADATAAVHYINRDTTERYAVVLKNGGLEVFDSTTGTQKTVTFTASAAYLATTNPRQDFALVSVADNTFIVNKSVKAATSSATAPGNPNVGYVVFSNYGAGIQRSMSLVVNGTTVATYTGASADIGAVISALVSAASTALGAGWTVTTPFNNIIKIAKGDSTTWSLDVTDNYGASTMHVVKGSVQTFDLLPQNMDDGYIVYISSRPTDSGTGYYVKYSASDRSYIECPAPGVHTSLDPTTMPHRLIRNADGTFTFDVVPWVDRLVGDDSSVPMPSCVGGYIRDMFLYRNRLGFLADESAILSSSGKYFNYFGASAATIIDSDPIDNAVATNKVSILRFAVPYSRVLLLFSDQTQFELSGGDTVTPRSIKADPVTQYQSSTLCRPVAAGSSLFFVVERSGHSGVFEYYIDQVTQVNEAAESTAHVPSYIPPSAFSLASSTTEDTLLLLTESERNAIYAYRYLWNGNQKMQSAWVKFVMDPGDSILGIDFIGTSVHMLVYRSDGLHLEKMDLQLNAVDSGLPFKVLLDRRVSLTGTYDAPTNTTSWNLPWTFAGTVQAVLGGEWGPQAGTLLTLTQGVSSTVATVTGDYSAHPVFIGLAYTARYRFSRPFYKDRNNLSVVEAKVVLRRLLVSYKDSGYFRVEVTPAGRATSKYTFTGPNLGSITLGSPSVSSGVKSVKAGGRADGLTVDLVNDSPFPSTFTSAEWLAEVVMKAPR